MSNATPTITDRMAQIRELEAASVGLLAGIDQAQAAYETNRWQAAELIYTEAKAKRGNGKRIAEAAGVSEAHVSFMVKVWATYGKAEDRPAWAKAYAEAKRGDKAEPTFTPVKFAARLASVVADMARLPRDPDDETPTESVNLNGAPSAGFY